MARQIWVGFDRVDRVECFCCGGFLTTDFTDLHG